MMDSGILDDDFNVNDLDDFLNGFGGADDQDTGLFGDDFLADDKGTWSPPDPGADLLFDALPGSPSTTQDPGETSTLNTPTPSSTNLVDQASSSVQFVSQGGTSSASSTIVNQQPTQNETITQAAIQNLPLPKLEPSTVKTVLQPKTSTTPLQLNAAKLPVNLQLSTPAPSSSGIQLQPAGSKAFIQPGNIVNLSGPGGTVQGTLVQTSTGKFVIQPTGQPIQRNPPTQILNIPQQASTAGGQQVIHIQGGQAGATGNIVVQAIPSSLQQLQGVSVNTSQTVSAGQGQQVLVAQGGVIQQVPLSQLQQHNTNQQLNVQNLQQNNQLNVQQIQPQNTIQLQPQAGNISYQSQVQPQSVQLQTSGHQIQSVSGHQIQTSSDQTNSSKGDSQSVSGNFSGVNVGNSQQTLNILTSKAQVINIHPSAITSQSGAGGIQGNVTLSIGGQAVNLQGLSVPQQQVLLQQQLLQQGQNNQQGQVVQGQSQVLQGQLTQQGQILQQVQGQVVNQITQQGQVVQGQNVQTQVVQGQAVQGQIVQGHIIQGQTVQGQNIQAKLVQSQNVIGQVSQSQAQTVSAQTVQGQTIQGQILQSQLQASAPQLQPATSQPSTSTADMTQQPLTQLNINGKIVQVTQAQLQQLQAFLKQKQQQQLIQQQNAPSSTTAQSGPAMATITYGTPNQQPAQTSIAQTTATAIAPTSQSSNQFSVNNLSASLKTTKAPNVDIKALGLSSQLPFSTALLNQNTSANSTVQSKTSQANVISNQLISQAIQASNQLAASQAGSASSQLSQMASSQAAETNTQLISSQAVNTSNQALTSQPAISYSQVISQALGTQGNSASNPIIVQSMTTPLQRPTMPPPPSKTITQPQILLSHENKVTLTRVTQEIRKLISLPNRTSQQNSYLKQLTDAQAKLVEIGRQEALKAQQKIAAANTAAQKPSLLQQQLMQSSPMTTPIASPASPYANVIKSPAQPTNTPQLLTQLKSPAPPPSPVLQNIRSPAPMRQPTPSSSPAPSRQPLPSPSPRPSPYSTQIPSPAPRPSPYSTGQVPSPYSAPSPAPPQSPYSATPQSPYQYLRSPVPSPQQPQPSPMTSQTSFAQPVASPMQQPTPSPMQPIPSPMQPIPSPMQPTQSPMQPIPSPMQPTPSPMQPISSHIQPQPSPLQQPLQSPMQPSPMQPHPSPMQQPIQSPMQPAPSPLQPQPSPLQLHVNTQPAQPQISPDSSVSPSRGQLTGDIITTNPSTVSTTTTVVESQTAAPPVGMTSSIPLDPQTASQPFPFTAEQAKLQIKALIQNLPNHVKLELAKLTPEQQNQFYRRQLALLIIRQQKQKQFLMQQQAGQNIQQNVNTQQNTQNPQQNIQQNLLAQHLSSNQNSNSNQQLNSSGQQNILAQQLNSNQQSNSNQQLNLSGQHAILAQQLASNQPNPQLKSGQSAQNILQAQLQSSTQNQSSSQQPSSEIQESAQQTIQQNPQLSSLLQVQSSGQQKVDVTATPQVIAKPVNKTGILQKALATSKPEVKPSVLPPLKVQLHPQRSSQVTQPTPPKAQPVLVQQPAQQTVVQQTLQQTVVQQTVLQQTLQQTVTASSVPTVVPAPRLTTASDGKQVLIPIPKPGGGVLLASQHMLRHSPHLIPKTTLFQAKLRRDQESVVKPDINQRFTSLKDAFRHLSKYHIYQTPKEEKHHIQEANKEYEDRAGLLMNKFDWMLSKYQYLLLQESMKESPSAEMLMLERMFLGDEKYLLAEDRKTATLNPDKFKPLPIVKEEIKSESKDPTKPSSHVDTTPSPVIKQEVNIKEEPMTSSTVKTPKHSPLEKRGHPQYSDISDSDSEITKPKRLKLEDSLNKSPSNAVNVSGSSSLSLTPKRGSKSAFESQFEMFVRSQNNAPGDNDEPEELPFSDYRNDHIDLTHDDNVDNTVIGDSDVSNMELPSMGIANSNRFTTNGLTSDADEHDQSNSDYEAITSESENLNIPTNQSDPLTIETSQSNDESQPGELNEEVQSAINSILSLQSPVGVGGDNSDFRISSDNEVGIGSADELTSDIPSELEGSAELSQQEIEDLDAAVNSILM